MNRPRGLTLPCCFTGNHNEHCGQPYVHDLELTGGAGYHFILPCLPVVLKRFFDIFAGLGGKFSAEILVNWARRGLSRHGRNGWPAPRNLKKNRFLPWRSVLPAARSFFVMCCCLPGRRPAHRCAMPTAFLLTLPPAVRGLGFFERPLRGLFFCNVRSTLQKKLLTNQQPFRFSYFRSSAGSNGQAFAALCTAGGNDLAAVLAGHPLHKAMDVAAGTLFRLKCLFHFCILLSHFWAFFV